MMRSVASSVTQTKPSAIAIPLPTAFVWIVVTTRSVFSSMRVRVRSSPLLTQIDPKPSASATGPVPTGMRSTTVFVSGLTR